MTASLVEVWRALRASRPVGEDQIQSTSLVLGQVETTLRLAVDSAGDLHLLVPTAGSVARAAPPDFNGLRIREGLLDDEKCIDLCAPAAYETMFAGICVDLVDAVVVQGRDPWAATLAITRTWQSAWRTVRQPMSRSVQIGLAGELLTMTLLWLPVLGTDAIHLWSGPDRERHDFVGPHLHMEVKTTTRDRHEHEISRVDQLSAPEGRRLLVASIQLEQSIAGTVSVATLIDEIVDQIRHDRAALDDFLIKLDGLDWSDDMRRSSDLLRFHLRDAQVFEVDDEFPQLPPDFVLPPGVLSVRYTISLANLPHIDADEVRRDISEAAELEQLR